MSSAKSVLDIILNSDFRGQGVQQARTGLTSLNRTVADSVQQMTGLNLTGISVAAALSAVVGALRQSVASFVEYADQVRTAVNLTGMTAEESSRLVQLSDDMGVGWDKLKTILQGANKNGFEPTIDNLAELADAYNAQTDVVKANQLVVDALGKSGLEYINVLKLGGDEIRARARETSKANLLDEQALALSREWEVATDGLGDAMQGLSTVLAQSVLPSLIWAVETTTRAVETTSLLVRWESDLTDMLREHSREVMMSSDSWEDWVTEVVRAQYASEGYADASQEMAEEVMAAYRAGQISEQQLASYTGDVRIYSEAVYGAARGTHSWGQAAGTILQQLRQMAIEGQSAADVSVQFSSQMDLVRAAINGPVGQAYITYLDQTRGLNEEHDALTEKLANLVERGYTPASSQVKELNEALAENERKQGAAAVAAEEATRQFVFQQAAAGLDAEATLYLARQMGMIDETSYQAAVQIQRLKEQYDRNRDGVIDATEATDGYVSKILELQTLANEGIPPLETTVRVGFEVDPVAQEWLSGTLRPGGGGGGVGPVAMADGGVAGGGYALVGERGPEVVRLPAGAMVYPTDAGVGGGGTIRFVVEGGASAVEVEAVAQRAAEILETRLRGIR